MQKKCELVNKNHNTPSRISTRKVDRRPDKRRKNHLKGNRFQLTYLELIGKVYVQPYTSWGRQINNYDEETKLVHSNHL